MAAAAIWRGHAPCSDSQPTFARSFGFSQEKLEIQIFFFFLEIKILSEMFLFYILEANSNFYNISKSKGTSLWTTFSLSAAAIQPLL